MEPPTRRRRRSPHALPPGRHGLPRSFVASNQRERLLEAVASVTARIGYPDTTVHDIHSAAGVSRKTFYEHFTNKEDAFLAASPALPGAARTIWMSHPGSAQALWAAGPAGGARC